MISGEYIQIKLPYYYLLKSYQLCARADANYYCGTNVYLVGSTTGESGAWIQLNYHSTLARPQETTVIYTITTTSYYNYFRLVSGGGIYRWCNVMGYNPIQFNQWRRICVN